MVAALRAPLRTPVAAALWLIAGVTSTVVWLLLGGGPYWPVWAWLGTGAAAATVAVCRGAWLLPGARDRWTALHAGLAAVAASVVSIVWMLTGGGAWLGWPLLGIGLAATVHALLAYADHLPPRPRERVLSARVDELIRTRRGALDIQDAELRRIERDLHDGAQSRLVALSLLLGRAEARVEDPVALELVRGARREASAAITELRDLTRGIAPPLLEERGLAAAVEGLVLRTPAAATLDAAIDRRLPRATEAAAYFVVAETLTNVAKHAPEARARVTLRDTGELLLVDVADDGPGTADAEGSGLLGLRDRVRALDGELTVSTGPDGGTTIRAELPCGW